MYHAVLPEKNEFILEDLDVVGCDGTNTNTGWKIAWFIKLMSMLDVHCNGLSVCSTSSSWHSVTCFKLRGLINFVDQLDNNYWDVKHCHFSSFWINRLYNPWRVHCIAKKTSELYLQEVSFFFLQQITFKIKINLSYIFGRRLTSMHTQKPYLVKKLFKKKIFLLQ